MCLCWFSLLWWEMIGRLLGQNRVTRHMDLSANTPLCLVLRELTLGGFLFDSAFAWE